MVLHGRCQAMRRPVGSNLKLHSLDQPYRLPAPGDSHLPHERVVLQGGKVDADLVPSNQLEDSLQGATTDTNLQAKFYDEAAEQGRSAVALCRDADVHIEFEWIARLQADAGRAVHREAGLLRRFQALPQGAQDILGAVARRQRGVLVVSCLGERRREAETFHADVAAQGFITRPQWDCKSQVLGLGLGKGLAAVRISLQLGGHLTHAPMPLDRGVLWAFGIQLIEGLLHLPHHPFCSVHHAVVVQSLAHRVGLPVNADAFHDGVDVLVVQ
mmetsp:Transcript_61277/g.114600  ORF Transcript_61277/g.114600 Transcript_61277/m.114600 type:complete len:271 (+) Transcript_61277:390-1202(+)